LVIHWPTKKFLNIFLKLILVNLIFYQAENFCIGDEFKYPVSKAVVQIININMKKYGTQ